MVLEQHFLYRPSNSQVTLRIPGVTFTSLTCHLLGYQVDFNFDYAALNKLQPFPLNNCGDPFMKSNYGVNSKQFEVAVLDWFARLWEIDMDEYWGYITSGSTEANFHAIIMGMDCIKIETLMSAEIDCTDFKAKLLQNEDKPAIINVNIGTTFKGAIDDMDLVIQTLEECGFSRNQFYIHCDGALSGLIVPFVEQQEQHTPIFLWYILSKKGHIGLRKDAQKCLQNAKYLKDRLINAGISLSCQGNIAHVVVMVSVSKEKLEAFLDELIEKHPTWSNEGAHPCVAFDIGLENCVCLLHR
ncbi:hypothetical protein Cgig2_014974 [Carnegiea gigantea]|uniref:Histidine decarboxylase n=1 Tax=Carnegiea gigantea TaxID=171969 RepID=A0A9Q1JWW0_9CARY|nr:hypothetical protein Cgig2_014974 [Carnegiea gigantea]